VRQVSDEEWPIVVGLAGVGAILSWTGLSESGLEISVIWISLGALVLLVLSPVLATARGLRARVCGEKLRRLATDPVFLMSLGFCLLLLAQWSNSGRALIYFPFEREWRHTNPPGAWLPWAFRREESRQMLIWFLPFFAAVTCLRHGLRGGAVRVLYAAMCLNAVVLAIYGLHGLTQVVYNPKVMVPPDRFATFTYQNHAGAFFLLILALASGLAASSAPRTGRKSCYTLVAVFVVVAMLAAAAAFLSLSRATFLLVICYLIGVGVWIGVTYLPRLGPSGRLQLGMVVIVLVISAVLLVAGGNRKWMVRELGGLTPSRIKESILSRDRRFQIDAAFRIWLDYPVYGVGGWGYRHLLPLYIDQEDSHRMRSGTANVHSDPIQFLTEFGVLGAGLLLGVLCVTVLPLCQPGACNSRILMFPLTGCLMLTAWSCVDLPFRHPAVLYYWGVGLAGSAVFARERLARGARR